MTSRTIQADEAISSLCSMFEQLERTVVEAVYESNHGDMEKVLDQLLEISEQVVDNNNNIQSSDTESSSKTNFNAKQHKVKVRNPLPLDFLCISRLESKSSQFSSLNGCKFICQDQVEVVSRMLENEMFQAELSQHKEFLPYIESLAGLFSGNGADSDNRVDEINSAQQCVVKLQENFDKLSEQARIKFNALAIRFKRSLDANFGEDYHMLFVPKETNSRRDDINLIDVSVIVNSNPNLANASKHLMSRRRYPGTSENQNTGAKEKEKGNREEDNGVQRLKAS
mmetsp:Transcript_9690/g.12583  ORF Transcript_9690/g.12583 Transcript_9690/m.12583 type:complete len:283 (+) Transcript_9690:343-1191(+)|eukprot:CAMPEP_0204828422 /NCGR_PEP_ID=MMETSP1346-20131115/6177_1 /ASSEMBLY_ACC=CAM_ASM_000771 /TAXON_ID=215587 /ORGANISM="Aplanochytrium stocchinoi, Strain GSBS06" /LENGTH=282 /DNA_ID=CAMNT_0051957477 /DNA_START=205 /DNA_END=1053 /DNA_ORIENTATION=+